MEVKVTKRGYEAAKAETTVPVVELLPATTARPTLYGIPVLYLTILMSLALAGYSGVKLRPVLRCRISVRVPGWLQFRK